MLSALPGVIVWAVVSLAPVASLKAFLCPSNQTHVVPKCPNAEHMGAVVPVGTPSGKPPTMAERIRLNAKGAQREQEDAHEFFNFLVDETHKELLRLRAAHAAALGDTGTPLAPHSDRLIIGPAAVSSLALLQALQCSWIPQ